MDKNILKFGALFCATLLLSFLMAILAKILGYCIDFFISEMDFFISKSIYSFLLNPCFVMVLKGALYIPCLVMVLKPIIYYVEWLRKKGEADFDQIGFDRYTSKIFCLSIGILIIAFLIFMYRFCFWINLK